MSDGRYLLVVFPDEPELLNVIEEIVEQYDGTWEYSYLEGTSGEDVDTYAHLRFPTENLARDAQTQLLQSLEEMVPTEDEEPDYQVTRPAGEN